MLETIKNLIPKLKIPFAGGLLIAAYCFCVYFFASPTDSSHQMTLGPYGVFKFFSFMLSLGALFCLRMCGFLSCGHMTTNVLIAIFLANLCIYTAVFYLAGCLFKRLKNKKTNGEGLTRREAIVCALVFFLSLLGLNFLRKDINNIKVVYNDLKIKDLPNNIKGVKLVLISDLHRGLYTAQDFLMKVVEKVNLLEPDIVLITGDYVYHNAPEPYSDVATLLSSLTPKIAVLGTFGNHDHWQNLEKAKDLYSKAGLKILSNQHLYLDSNRKITDKEPETGLCIAGVDDLWEGKVNFVAALNNVSPKIPCIVLSHNPDAAELSQAKGFRVDAMLAGHTHGGQVILPVVGPLGLSSQQGLKYISGWNQGPYYPVYTNVGIGTTVLPFRCGSVPEITVFTLS